jgi:hypothetical protein
MARHFLKIACPGMGPEKRAGVNNGVNKTSIRENGVS